MFMRFGWFLAALGAIVLLLQGCQESEGPPADYSSFYKVDSRQWVTKVEGIKPEEIGGIRQLVEQVDGVAPGSVVIGKDYVAFGTTAKREDRMEHSRIGSDVSAVLKKQPGLRVGDSTTGPQP